MDTKTISAFAVERALVIGGGGSIGNAWLIGVTAGLFDAGLDLTQADLTIGTSAGSTTAVQITSGTQAPDLFASVISEMHQQKTGSAGADRIAAPNRPGANHLETTGTIIAAATDAADMRRRMGAWALGVETMSNSAAQAQWRATVGARLPKQTWPQRQLAITAVDAHTGEPVIFDNHSGVALVDAVAASCAGGFAYAISDRHYIDGGYRCNADNADLAVGYGRVLVLSPFGGRSRLPVEWGMHLATQIEELRAQGSRVETIFPDSAALDAFGGNMMDVSRRPAAAQAGYNQGKALAGQLAEFWS